MTSAPPKHMVHKITFANRYQIAYLQYLCLIVTCSIYACLNYMSYLCILHAYLRSLLSMSTCSSLEELKCYQHRHKTFILLININLPYIFIYVYSMIINQLLIIHTVSTVYLNSCLNILKTSTLILF